MNLPEPNPDTEPKQSPQPAEPQTAPDDTPLRTARRNIAVGLALCVGGVLLSLVSYRTAEAGGRYFIASGAIFWGVVQSLIGVCGSIGYCHRTGDTRRGIRIILSSLAVLAAGILLLLAALRDEEENTVPLLDTEQEYRLPAIGMRVRIPAGYTPWEETLQEETDSTFAHSQMYVLDGAWEFAVHTLQDAIADDVESIAEIWEYCAGLDSCYYDAGIVSPLRFDMLGKREVLCSEGCREEYPDDLFTICYMQQGRTLVTVYIIYPVADYGLRTTRLRTLRLLGGIRFEEPAPAEEERPAPPADEPAR